MKSVIDYKSQLLEMWPELEEKPGELGVMALMYAAIETYQIKGKFFDVKDGQDIFAVYLNQVLPKNQEKLGVKSTD